MTVDESLTTTVDRLIGFRLRQLQQVTGLPVVFGGATSAETRATPQLRIGHLRGTFGRSLLDLRVDAGQGLGGSAVQTGALRTVRDYAATQTITHDFDAVVVQQERLSSIFALPLKVSGTIRGVIYGALREPRPIGDIILDRATAFGSSMERELITLIGRPEPALARPSSRVDEALDRLNEIAVDVTEERIRDSLLGVARELRELIGDDTPGSTPQARASAGGGTTHLAPREIQALRLVAIGMSNSEVADVLHLSTETVRAYLRSAMRRLNVRNRTAAVHAARNSGLL